MWYYRDISLKRLKKKTRETSARIDGVPPKIRTGHVPNMFTSQKRYLEGAGLYAEGQTEVPFPLFLRAPLQTTLNLPLALTQFLPEPGRTYQADFPRAVPSAQYLILDSFSFSQFFDPEDRGDMFLRTTGHYNPKTILFIVTAQRN
jgi:hypothetical protein